MNRRERGAYRVCPEDRGERIVEGGDHLQDSGPQGPPLFVFRGLRALPRNCRASFGRRRRREPEEVGQTAQRLGLNSVFLPIRSTPL